MKTLLFLMLLIPSTLIQATPKGNEWNATSLTDDIIKKIQQSQFQYKACVTKEMQKTGYEKIDSRDASGAIIKQCEQTLSKMRQVYLDAKVPEVIADRHLKKMRIDTTRKVLKQLMFTEAARKSGK